MRSGASRRGAAHSRVDARQNVATITDALMHSFVVQQLQSQPDAFTGKQDETITAINALRLEV